MPNELYREREIKYPDGTMKKGILLSDEDGIYETALDYMKKIKWD